MFKIGDEVRIVRVNSPYIYKTGKIVKTAHDFPIPYCYVRFNNDEYETFWFYIDEMEMASNFVQRIINFLIGRAA
jgi:hypothetical protein